MNNIKISAIDRLSNLTNTSSNLQQAIIGVASFDEILHKEIQKLKIKQQTEEKQKQSTFEFKPEDIQTLVYRNHKHTNEER